MPLPEHVQDSAVTGRELILPFILHFCMIIVSVFNPRSWSLFVVLNLRRNFTASGLSSSVVLHFVFVPSVSLG